MARVVDSSRYIQQTLFDTGPNMTEIDEYTDALMRATRAKATHAAYDSDFRIFQAFCANAGRTALPATDETLRRYVGYRLKEGAKINTVDRAIAAITFHHRAANLPVPDRRPARSVLAAEKRRRKEKPVRKAALTADHIAKICKRLVRSKDPSDIRDRAILTLGVTSAFRRSNITSLNVDDVKFLPEGVGVYIASSKTDQVGEGKWFSIWNATTGRAVCPAHALQAWLKLRGDKPGPLFTRISRAGRILQSRLNSNWVNRIVKEEAQRLGLDPARYGAHSLRASYVTIAHNNRASTMEIMEQTGHTSHEMVHRYLRNEVLFSGRNPLARAI